MLLKTLRKSRVRGYKNWLRVRTYTTANDILHFKCTHKMHKLHWGCSCDSLAADAAVRLRHVSKSASRVVTAQPQVTEYTRAGHRFIFRPIYICNFHSADLSRSQRVQAPPQICMAEICCDDGGGGNGGGVYLFA